MCDVRLSKTEPVILMFPCMHSMNMVAIRLNNQVFSIPVIIATPLYLSIWSLQELYKFKGNINICV
jgi:hypothetical protein